MSDEDSSDVELGFCPKGFYVEPPSRTIDLDTVCRDGNEYVLKVRLEMAESLREGTQVSRKPPEENEEQRMWSEARKAALEFSHYALHLLSDNVKTSLRKKFPKKFKIPNNGPSCIKEWCTFCLGSKLCSKIYKESYKEPSEEIEGHLPVLSIIVHFSEYTAFTVLKHLHEWFLSLGMEESLGKWTYVVLAYIKKPLDEATKELMKTFYFDCKKRLKDCDESERPQLFLISTIFSWYFCVNSDKVGPSLEAFLNL